MNVTLLIIIVFVCMIFSALTGAHIYRRGTTGEGIFLSDKPKDETEEWDDV